MSPGQIVEGDAVAATDWPEVTVIVTVPELEQPLAFVPTTVYVVVNVGVAIGEVVLETLRLLPGDHW